MKEYFLEKLAAAKIEWHWWRVKRLRRQMSAKIEAGTPYSLPNLTVRSQKVFHHLREAVRLQRELEAHCKQNMHEKTCCPFPTGSTPKAVEQAPFQQNIV